MTWAIEFYNKDVYAACMKWPAGIKARLINIVRMMQKYGADLGMPHTKSLGNGLFEIRAKGKEGIGRAFFCYFGKEKAVILHSFIKKTQQIPKKELEIATQRMRELNNE